MSKRRNPLPSEEEYPQPRILISPSAAGLAFIGMLATMLLGSINYNISLGYVLTFLLGAVWLVCMMHTSRNLTSVRFTGGRAQPVFAGEPAEFFVTIDNRGGPPCFAIELIREHKPRGMRSFTRDTLTTIDIERDTLGSYRVTIPAKSRGRVDFGNLWLVSRFPLGLFRTWMVYETRLSCTVYPRPKGNRQLPAASPATGSNFTGEQRGSDDFLGFRPYARGDSPKNIAWKTLAKTEEIQVKHFAGSGSVGHRFNWDVLNPRNSEELRLSQLCLWVLEADTLGLPYELEIPNKTLPTNSGPEQRSRCLEALALYGLEQ